MDATRKDERKKEMKAATADILIPAYHPGAEMEELLKRLKKQTYPIERIYIINTDEKGWNPRWQEIDSRILVTHISKKEFDHGGTRKMAAEKSEADYMIFMTQDAMPADTRLVEHLIKAFEQPGVKAAYARQLPREDCRLAERYTRSFNYPAKSFCKGKEDLPRLGIKTYFCSNVCAAYEKKAYQELGGFIDRAIFNEDMIFAGTLIQKGYQVAYVSEARVIHSHNYNCMQQYRRNFDLGVSQKEHPEIFEGIRSEGEGMRLVLSTVKYLIRKGKPYLVPGVFLQSVFKYLGYFCGRHYENLPGKFLLWSTMNKEYWKK